MPGWGDRPHGMRGRENPLGQIRGFIIQLRERLFQKQVVFSAVHFPFDLEL